MHSYKILAVAGAIDLAESMQQDKALAKRILDFLGLEVSESWDGQLRIFFKKSKHLVFTTVVEDEGHAAWTILYSSCVYDVRHGKCTRVENPFYGKSLEEIKIMLDLLGDKT